MAKLFLLIGSVNAGLCIVLGAFAAHKLKTVLGEASLATFQTGVQYHFYHSLALLLLGVIMIQLNGADNYFRYSGFAFVVGILLFSGSLYGLSFELGKWLGPVTPIGGLAFILAWSFLAIGVYKSL